ncbi:MAG: nitroreductase [Nitrospirae bacterium]|nr:nitroreductase [Nitrospirota bacterium]
MDIIEGIEKRKSIRAFKPDPVPRKALEKVLQAAVAAPSKGNSQIWEFVAITGNELKDIKVMLGELLKTDFIPLMKLTDEEAPSPALEKAKIRSSRNKEEMSKILNPMGLDFDDFMLEGTFRFFDAPAAVMVFIEDIYLKNLPHLLSVGAAVQNMLLSAQTLGLGTCWIGGVWRYTKQIRKILGIPDNKMLVSSVAIGYPDNDSPINKYKSGRDSIDDLVQWKGFE